MKKLWVVGLGSLLSFNSVRGAIYNGNGSTYFGGAVGTGSLQLTDNGTTLSGTFTRGTGGLGSFSDILVIFIDSKPGGFSSTSGFTDASSLLTKAISGVDGTGNRTIADFPTSGFLADYAIALRPASAAGSDQLFQLANAGSHTGLGTVSLSPVGTTGSSTYNFSVNLTDLGMVAGQGGSFKFESSYVSSAGVHSLESFETFTGDSEPQNTVTFDSFHTYVTAVPEPANAALAVFSGLALGAGTLIRLRKRVRRLVGRARQ